MFVKVKIKVYKLLFSLIKTVNMVKFYLSFQNISTRTSLFSRENHLFIADDISPKFQQQKIQKMSKLGNVMTLFGIDHEKFIRISTNMPGIDS